MIKRSLYVASIVAILSSCSMDKLYKMRQTRKVSAYEQVEFGDIVKRYFIKDQTSVGTIEGIYSVSSYVSKKGKGVFSSTEKEKSVDKKENYSTVAIIRDPNKSTREYLEVPLDKTYLSSYSVRGEFTGIAEGNIILYKHIESRNRILSYTFTYDKTRDMLEGIRIEKNGSFEVTYKLTYVKLYPRAGGSSNGKN